MVIASEVLGAKQSQVSVELIRLLHSPDESGSFAMTSKMLTSEIIFVEVQKGINAKES